MRKQVQRLCESQQRPARQVSDLPPLNASQSSCTESRDESPAGRRKYHGARQGFLVQRMSCSPSAARRLVRTSTEAT